MGKIIHEMGESEFDRMVDERAELKLLRLFATGNPNQSALTTLHIPHHQPQQPTHVPTYQPYYAPTALPAPPQPPALPSAPMPPTTALQDATVIQAQATVLPPSPPVQTIAIPAAPKLPKLTKRQQRAIAICAGLAAGMWLIDAVFPGSLGKAIQGVQALYQDAPTLPTTETPATESTAEPTPTETPAETQESSAPSQTIEADPNLVERIREAARKPAAPTE